MGDPAARAEAYPARWRRALGTGMALALILGVASLGGDTGRGPGPGHGRGLEGLFRLARQARPWHPPRALVAPWVVAENRRPGSSGWRFPYRRNAAIEGYASRVSARRGDTVTLFVSTSSPRYRVEAYRMGWYRGLGGRLVWASPALPGVRQSHAVVDPATQMVEARWRPSLRVRIGPAWPPGCYLLVLVASNGDRRRVPLTVRDDASHAAILVQDSVTTWQAYNRWGGHSLYLGPPSQPQARSVVVSFDRPYAGDGSGDFYRDELPLVQLVERDGLDVSYWTDVDLHEHPDWLKRHRVLVTLGHDEYWSLAMRQGAERARDHGVNLLFLGANAAYRHIRLRPSPLGPDRREVNYRVATLDPLLGRDNRDVTVQWRDPLTDRPESALVGEQYECNPVIADMVVADAGAWVFQGTGLRNGEGLHNVVGYEYDRVMPRAPTPPTLQVLAHSPVDCLGKRSFSEMTYYTVPSGAGVLATGTIAWICSMGNNCVPGWGDRLDVPLVRRITENVLAAFGLGPAGRQHPSRPNLRRLGIRVNPAGVAAGPGPG